MNWQMMASNIVTLIFLAGVCYARLNAIEKRLARLEKFFDLLIEGKMSRR